MAATDSASNTQIYYEFYSFCRKGDVNRVQFYLDAKLDAKWINEKDRRRSLLMATAWKDSEEVCRLLIEKHALLNHQDASGNTALHLCSKQNSIRVAKQLLSAGADANKLAENNITPLMICADLGHTELAQLLLQLPNIELNQQSSRGLTALMKAIFENSVDIAIELIQRGAKLDLESQSGFTALHLCAQLDRRRIASHILAKAPSGLVNRVTRPEFKGNTAFTLAALNGHVRMLRLLKQHGADPNHRNIDGRTALDEVKLSCGNGATELKQLLESWSTGSSDNEHRTQATVGQELSNAIRNNNVNVVRSLISKKPEGASLAATPDPATGLLPLMLASSLNKPELLKLLIEAICSDSSIDKKMCINSQSSDSSRATALHAAVQCASEACVRLLLDAGASLAVKNADGATPLHLCADLASAKPIAKLLIDRASRDDLMSTTNPEGRVPTVLAAVRGQIDVLRLMLEQLQRIDTQTCSTEWLPVIREAAQKARQFEAANVVLELMPKTQKNNEDLIISKFFKAAMDRNTDEVRRLLTEEKLSKYINERNQQSPGWTALMATAWNDDAATCKLLLEHGADPNVRELSCQKLEVTALHIAVQQDSRQVAKLLLEQKSIDLDARSSDRRTPLIRAAWLNHKEIARLLLENNADVNAQEIDGFSALHFCAQENLVELAKLLIHHGANLDSETNRSKNRNTAFTLAAVKGNIDMLELLANVGADIYHRSLRGDAMDLAKRAKRTQTIELLLRLDRERSQITRSCTWDVVISPEPSRGTKSSPLQLDAGQSGRPDLPAEPENPSLNSSVVTPICGYQYSMRSNPRGICVVINNEEFVDSEATPRMGSRKDVERLQTLFRDKLKFRVQVHQNLDARDILALMNSLAACDRHTKFDCFVAFIMSHGELDSVLGCDGERVGLDDIFAPFQRCKSLQRKPKLFFLQACRKLPEESNIDQVARQDSRTDQSGGNLNRMISEKLDFLFSYAVTKGDFALRCPETGSLFIQNLCHVIETHHNEHHLCAMLNMVRQILGQRPVPAPADLGDGREIIFNLPSETTQLQGDVWFKDLDQQSQ